MSKDFKIYTKTGDDGTTGLVGGSRVKKNSIRLEAYGTVDELNSALGLLRSYDIQSDISKILVKIQNKLFNIGSRLASDEKGEELTAPLAITEQDILFLETSIDQLEQGLPELTHFILPGGEITSAQCHVARTICRRAERRILDFAEHEKVQIELIVYINRLSDFLFVLGRKLAFDNQSEEIGWKKD